MHSPLHVSVSPTVILLCTESQARYMLGMRYRGNFVVGLSDKSPRQPRDRAASCPVNYRTPCNAATAAMPDRPNPHVLTGALVSRVSPAAPALHPLAYLKIRDILPVLPITMVKVV